MRYVHDLGLLDERMMVIHAIWLDAADIELLAASGCTVAHNPVCNLRLGSGVMPWNALRAAGVPIALGSDEMNTDDTDQHVVRRQDRCPAPDADLRGIPCLAGRARAAAPRSPAAAPGRCAARIALASSRQATRPT